MNDSLELTKDDFIILDMYRRSLDELLDETYHAIRHLYAQSTYKHWVSDGSDLQFATFKRLEDEFKKLFFGPIEESADLEPPKYVSPKKPEKKKHLREYLRVAASWLVLAKRGQEKSDPDQANYCAAKAQYWVGRSEQLSGLPLELLYAQHVRQKKAAKARVAKADPIREFAVGLVKDNPGRFNGPYAAAAAIEPKVLDKIEEQTGKRPVAGSKKKSVARWLAHFYAK